MHHSATKDGDTLSYPAILRYHTETKGWRNIGYHLVIERFEGGLLLAVAGRPLDETGAHAKGWNLDSVGVCIVGNFDDEPPADDVLAFTADHVGGLCRILELEPNAETIRPHRDVAPWKTCPGRMFPMEDFIRRVRNSI